LLVVGLQPARPQSEVQATIRQQVESRRFFRDHDRMAVVVVEDEKTDPQLGGGIRGRHESRER
jgi:hypothetical protein